MDLRATCEDLARRARRASRQLATATGGKKNRWLQLAACSQRASKGRWRQDEPRTESRAEREDHARDVHVFVHQLVELAHERARVQVLRHQGRVGERLVQVIKNHGRFDHGPPIVHDEEQAGPVSRPQ